MIYYLIFLHSGEVVEICSYDDEHYRDEYFGYYYEQLKRCSSINGKPFDDVQKLNVVR